MNHLDDFQQDRRGEFYVDEVADQPDVFGVFGSESGRCYATYLERSKAMKQADAMNAPTGAV